MMKLNSDQSLVLFTIVAMLSSLSIIPLAISRVDSPKIEEPSSLELLHLIKLSPQGVMSCGLAGLIMGAIYGLMPVYITQLVQDPAVLGSLMACLILGGMSLQYPFGKLSDFFPTLF